MKEHEIEMLKQKKELLELEKGKSQKAPDAPRHRFPTFNEKTDDLDTFFQPFECQAKLLKVNESELKSYLLSCLSGKAREIFNSLPFESDYESTKNVLLQRYNFTPNEYRRKFLTHVPQVRKIFQLMYIELVCILIDGSVYLRLEKILIVLEI